MMCHELEPTPEPCTGVLLVVLPSCMRAHQWLLNGGVVNAFSLGGVEANLSTRQRNTIHDTRVCRLKIYSGPTLVLVPLMLHLSTEALNAD